MPNKWVEHVRKWSADHGVSYMCATSMPACKEAYKPVKAPKNTKKANIEQMGMEDKDVALPKKAKKGITADTLKDKIAQIKEAKKMGVEDIKSALLRRAVGIVQPLQSADTAVVKPKGRPKKYETAEEAKRMKSVKTVEARKARKAKVATPVATPVVVEAMEIAEPTQSTKQGFSQKTIDEVKSTLAKKVAQAKAVPPKGKLKPSEVKDFASRLPEGLEKYTASFLLETDPLKEFDSKNGLYALYYSLGLLGDFPYVHDDGSEIYTPGGSRSFFPEVGHVKYGKQMTRTQKYGVVLPDWAGRVTPRGKPGVVLSAPGIIDSMNAVNGAVKTIMAKNRQSDWDAEVYYAKSPDSKSSIRCIVRWTGKKGQRGQNALWQEYWKANIRPLMMDSARWDRALDRVSERKEGVEADKAVAREATVAETTRIGAEAIKTDKSTADLMKIVQVTLADNDTKLHGYTVWKDKPANYIIGRMKEIFDKPPEQWYVKDGKPVMKDLRRVWRFFKERVEAKPLGNFSEKKRIALEKAYYAWDNMRVEEESYDTTEEWEEAIESATEDILRRYGVSEKDFNTYKKLKRGRGYDMEGGAGSYDAEHADEMVDNYSMIINHLVEHISDPSEPVDPRDYDQAIHFIREMRRAKGGAELYYGGMMPAGAPPPPPPRSDAGRRVFHTPGLLELMEQFLRPAGAVPEDIRQAIIDGRNVPRLHGGDLGDDLRKGLHEAGKPFSILGINPGSSGFDLGRNVIAPAMMKTKWGNPKTGIFSKSFWTPKKHH